MREVGGSCHFGAVWTSSPRQLAMRLLTEGAASGERLWHHHPTSVVSVRLSLEARALPDATLPPIKADKVEAEDLAFGG